MRLAIPARAFELLSTHARKLHLTLNLAAARPLLQDALERTIDIVEHSPTAATVAQAVSLIEGGERLGVGLGHWEAQNRFFALSPEAGGPA